MEYNDFELIEMAKEKNEEAINYLYKKYKPLLEKKAREYYTASKNKGGEYNDFYQEAMLGFEDAISYYNQDSNALFYTFVNICVDRQLKSMLIRLNREKHKLLNESVSLDYLYEDNSPMINFIKEDKNNPEDLLINVDNESKLYKKIVAKLSKYEKEIIDLKIKGYGINEIAKKLNKEPSKISCALYRIRTKIKDII